MLSFVTLLKLPEDLASLHVPTVYSRYTMASTAYQRGLSYVMHIPDVYSLQVSLSRFFMAPQTTRGSDPTIRSYDEPFSGVTATMYHHGSSSYQKIWPNYMFLVYNLHRCHCQNIPSWLHQLPQDLALLHVPTAYPLQMPLPRCTIMASPTTTRSGPTTCSYCIPFTDATATMYHHGSSNYHKIWPYYMSLLYILYMCLCRNAPSWLL